MMGGRMIIRIAEVRARDVVVIREMPKVDVEEAAGVEVEMAVVEDVDVEEAVHGKGPSISRKPTWKNNITVKTLITSNKD
mmetsp:Transcript_507/g.570  ORF Transcript_507/g.570 Transcript_507/m.570 type:complete len:80 (+) Transcript_507:2910-3149(+)